jgi:ABC-type lipoprotein release transport system permease subunit
MGAIVMLARVELRRRWRSVIVLTLLVGFAGAVVLALSAGARRTETSLARFERESRSANVELDAGDTTPAQLEQFRRSPGVAAVTQLQQLTLVAPDGQFLPTAAQVDTRFGRVIDRPRIVAGRAVDLHAVDELNIGEALAEQLHVKVGDRLRFRSLSPVDVKSQEQVFDPHGPRVTFRVVGIVRRPLDLGGRGAAGGVIVPTPAFLARYRDQIGSYSGSVLRVRTRNASDVPRVAAAARRIFDDSPSFSFTSLSIEGQAAQNAIDVTTVGLYVAAAVALLTALVGIGIALSREIALGDAQQLTLSALGIRPRDRVAAAAAIAVPIAVLGGALAAAGAVLASPIFPIGVAAKAEPVPGIRVDALTVGLGFVAIVAVVLLISLVAGVRTAHATRPERQASTPGVAARVTAQAGTSPPVAVGIRFALDRGQQRRALPVRSSLFGAAFGVVVVVAVLVFAAGLDHLVSTPAEFGWTWDLAAFDAKAIPKGGDDCGPITTRFTRVAGIADIASVCNASVEVAGRPVTAWGFGSIRGHIGPAIVDGRAPRDDDEVALGADTLAAVHRAVGDRVRIAGVAHSNTFHVVGSATFASMSDPQPLADGAVFTAHALNALGANGGWNLVVRLAPGADRTVVAREVAPPKGAGGDVSYVLPAEIDRVRQIRGLPLALAVFVAVVALVAVGLGLVASVRRRRRELAVLKTLGFTRRQVRTTVASQATTVAAVGLVIGIPFGILIGAFVWRSVADELGVSNGLTWPVLGIVALVAGALFAVNVIAAVPAARAARTRPAAVLRSE